jgi:nucleotide-binding universal stress UspA family protein
MYQKILVPLDGSELAECVFPHVEAIARGCQVKSIVFIRVVEPFHQPAGDYVFNLEEIQRIDAQQKLAAEDYLKKVSSKINQAGAAVKIEAMSGRPAEVLADYATKNQVDLIVIATHGRSGVSRWVWGSVADRILRSACIPVLMVRAPGCFPGI